MIISYVFKDNNIHMNVECWVGRGNKVLVKILSVDDFRYYTFKQH